ALGVRTSSSGIGMAPAPAVQPVKTAPAPALLAGVVGLTAAVTAAITLVVHGCLHQPATWAPTRLSITAPPGTQLDEDSRRCAISPGGALVAVTAPDSSGAPQIYVRSLDSFAARPLPGTENASDPFWSPDERFLGFFADGKLKKAPLAGGEVEPLANASNG